MDKKYLKYKIKYLKLKFNNQKGGFIDDLEKPITLIRRKFEDSGEAVATLDKCHFIDSIEWLPNTGKNNLGIGFLNVDDKKIFLKVGDRDTLWNDFVFGYFISTLKPFYPYFIDVYGYMHCNNLGRPADVLLAQKGTETIYEYFCRHTYDYIKKIIPDYEDIVLRLDDIFTAVMAECGTTIGRYDMYYFDGEPIYGYSDSSLDSVKIKEKRKEIIKKYEEYSSPIFQILFVAFLKFKNIFIPQFIKNLRIIGYEYIMLDMLTMTYFGDFISDKKSDNFMVNTKPYVIDTPNFVKIRLGPDKYKDEINFVNVAHWDDCKEQIYMYPVDFGCTNINITPEMTMSTERVKVKFSDISRTKLNEFINSNLKLSFYTNSRFNGTLESLKNNILQTEGTTAKIRLSLNYHNFLIANYNPFEIIFSDKATSVIGEMILGNFLPQENLNNFYDVFKFLISAYNENTFPVWNVWSSPNFWSDGAGRDVLKYDIIRGPQPVVYGVPELEPDLTIDLDIKTT
jgi:hypothetical protein